MLEQGLYVAGGNVDGTADGGGIFESFMFDPNNANEDLFPYGWEEGPVLEVDRWYPTLTALPTGEVLISGGASTTTVDVGGSQVNGRNTFELYDPIAGTVTLLPVTFDWGNMPTYPFMFVLPNGDVLYAGGEGAEESAWDGRVLVPDYDAPQLWDWASGVSFASATDGGSAAMYAPGKILKSGGSVDGYSVKTTEILELEAYPSGDYTGAPTTFTAVDDMEFARHFHTLTLLPDGRVLATGGNERGNGAPWHRIDNDCDVPEGSENWIKDIPCMVDADCPAVPATCNTLENTNLCYQNPSVSCTSNSECAASCTVTADCPSGATCMNGDCLLGSEAAMGVCVNGERCDPARNDCYATRAAEIWDPGCEEWVLLGEQDRARMYHSTALLIPDGRVISMGSGHRGTIPEETNAEYFEPAYSAGVAPSIEITGMPQTDGVFSTTIAGDSFSVSIENAGDFVPNEVVLMRLSSVTHGFDVEQRRVPVWANWEIPWTGKFPVLNVFPPDDPNDAPPGYYMLFVLSAAGEPSEGKYVRLSRGVAQIWKCPAAGLVATETSCTAEPSSGACPAGDEELNTVALPQASGPSSGTSDGWQIAAPPGAVLDAANPTAKELATLEELCIDACLIEWGDQAVSANCGDAGAFDPPEYVGFEDDEPALDSIPAWHQNGQGVFAGELTCDLGASCFAEFDEDLSKARLQRSTPAESVLESGEEYRIPLGSSGSKLTIVTSAGMYSTTMTGEVGFSECRDGNSVLPCAFYMGSMNADTVGIISVPLQCDDQTTDVVRIDDVNIHLGQPAFGIAAGSGSNQRAFPPGGLVLDSRIKVNGLDFGVRQPSAAKEVVLRNQGSGFAAIGMEVLLRLPCNTSATTVTARVNLVKSGSPLDQPPAIAITTPAQVSCSGAVNLTANASDPDQDLVGTRWRVDGVLLAPGTTSIPFSEAHTLEAVAEDARGARTTDTKVVTCL